MDTIEIEERALRSIRRIIRRVAAHSRQLSQQTGLTLPQLLCLRAIHRSTEEEVTAAGVADVVQLSRPTVSGVIDRLVRAGLVHRDRSTRDRRRLNLSVTEAGRQHLAGLPTHLQDSFVRRLAALPIDDQERLLSALEQVVELMDADELDAAPMLVPGAELPTPG